MLCYGSAWKAIQQVSGNREYSPAWLGCGEEGEGGRRRRGRLVRSRRRTAQSSSRAGDVFSVLRARHVREASPSQGGEPWRGRLESRQGRGRLRMAPPGVEVEGPMGAGKRRDSRDTR